MQIQQFALAGLMFADEQLWPLLRLDLHPKWAKQNMRKKLTSSLMVPGVLLPIIVTLCHAQNQQGFSGNAPPAQTPAAQRENYDPLLDLPPLPNNTVTLIGGTVSGLDEVMNHMIFQPFGEKKKMHVSFDTRTRFYRDGKPVSYREIKQGQRVYLDTMLNGNKVFAKSIWIQSTADSGIGRGQIISFDPQKSTLTLRDELSSQAIKMQLTPSTVIRSGEGMTSTAELVPGALVSLSFGPLGELREVMLSAKPGSQFTFAGRVSYLDLSRKLIAVDNSSDKLKYDISIEAIAPNILRQIHEGDNVAVVAVFDGSRYDARRIDLPSSANQNQP